MEQRTGDLGTYTYMIFSALLLKVSTATLFLSKLCKGLGASDFQISVFKRLMQNADLWRLIQ